MYFVIFCNITRGLHQKWASEVIFFKKSLRGVGIIRFVAVFEGMSPMMSQSMANQW